MNGNGHKKEQNGWVKQGSSYLNNIDTCLDCGIKKVFIINHAVSLSELTSCFYTAKQYAPNLWIGINMLGVGAHYAVTAQFGRPSRLNQMEHVLDGLWCDQTITPQVALIRKFKGMLFGGVAFKYQPQPVDLKVACEEAKTLTNVATTSGVGTGKSAHPHKIKLMRSYLGDHPLAIASGISSDNINDYLGIANYLLVASSITDDNEMIVKSKLQDLISKL